MILPLAFTPNSLWLCLLGDIRLNLPNFISIIISRLSTNFRADPHLVPELAGHYKAMHGCPCGWFRIHESSRSVPNLTND